MSLEHKNKLLSDIIYSARDANNISDCGIKNIFANNTVVEQELSLIHVTSIVPYYKERFDEIEKALLGTPIKDRLKAIKKNKINAQQKLSALAHELEFLNEEIAKQEEREFLRAQYANY